MDVVGHEAESVHSIIETASPFLQQEIEAAAVLVGKKDRLASVTAENDVVESTGEMNSRFTYHVDSIAELVNLSTSKPTLTCDYLQSWSWLKHRAALVYLP